MDAGRVIYYLNLWRDFMKFDNNKLGFKSKSTGFMSGGLHSFEDLGDEVDRDAARAVDKVIDDLPTPQKTSIYIIYLGQKSMIDIKVLEDYYDSALVMLQKRLPEKNLY
jgi:S-ribosylhomocysteine lyase LuxS involved in autoinducer biosynthesis